MQLKLSPHPASNESKERPTGEMGQLKTESVIETSVAVLF